jgi:polyhydroxybutyrate depolymerase
MTGQFNGLKRDWLLHLPMDYDKNKAYPMIMSFHGWGGYASDNVAWTGLTHLSEAKDFIAVYVQGQKDCSNKNCWSSWNAGGCSNITGPAGYTCSTKTRDEFACTQSCKALGQCNTQSERNCNWCSCVNDVDFVRQLMDLLESKLCIATKKVCATGESNGGIFMYDLASQLSDRIGAIVPFIAQPLKGFMSLPPTKKHVSLLQIHGKRDKVIPPAGGESEDGWYYHSVDETMKAWADHNLCTGASTPYTPPVTENGFDCRKPHGKCAPGTDVITCTFNGNHYTETKKFGALLTWKFCNEHPLQ